ncbi:dihydrodipicolinate synthase family protein [Aquibium sp. A9E412]|uniref:dihydrodipicolinate synthase family protein n=1 Tax=Aquibium sp. A9E412 TaxID=2976767 RepID=UPI0025B1C4F9|nr:dihydrodipicolinate synthase family protein [Aquibium sp. A9E412]MDN2567201.1 dihydrodipicolinate synthase family protein [Aquibium sp. A9E412]
MTQDGLGGVVAAVPTPVTAAGEPDTERFCRHAAWALGHGCDALNVLGTTGEANSLSAGQRGAVMRAAAGALDTRRLMVGTGTPDLPTTAALTRLAGALGFAAALVLPPYYYKGVSDDGLFAWFAGLVEATAETAIPLYLYNFPQMTGIAFAPALAERLAKAFPGRIAGAKDSSGDLAYTAALARIDGFKVFPSSETALAAADRDGYAGCISATVSVTAPLVARLWADRGNADLLRRAEAARAAIAAQPLIPAVKHLVGRLHGDAAFARVLPPLMPLAAGEARALDGLEIAAA